MFIASAYLCEVYAASAVSYDTFSGTDGVVATGVLGVWTVGVGTGSPVETCWCFSWPPHAAMLTVSATAAGARTAILARYILGSGWGCAPSKAIASPSRNSM